MNTVRRYYILNVRGAYEGPYDLSTMMRKIRAGKIQSTTFVTPEGEQQGRSASEISELAALFTVRPIKGTMQEIVTGTAESRFMHTIHTGWRFVGQQPLILVIASLGVMACVSAGLLFSRVLPWWICLGISFGLYLTFQSLMMATVLRIYRGQYLDGQFLNRYISPLILPLLTMSLILTVLGMVGLVAFILPGLLIFSLFVFTPFIISEGKGSAFSAFSQSAQLVTSDGLDSFAVVLALVTLNLLSILLIITLPIIAVALTELYDEFSH